MSTLMIFPLAALALAVSAYAYLAKRQPEYPNARVIAVFTLLGGGLGGLLVLLAFLRAEYSGSNVALAVAVGALASAAMGLVWAHDGIAAVWTACVGGLSAAILSAIVLPKAL